jgi:predicted nucleotidyltransferase
MFYICCNNSTMIPLIKRHLPELEKLCKVHNVESFYLVGSAARDEMQSNSDIDFLVRFTSKIQVLDYCDNYLDLLLKLKELFQTNVDLISEKSLKNPILIKSLNDSKIAIYES